MNKTNTGAVRQDFDKLMEAAEAASFTELNVMTLLHALVMLLAAFIGFAGRRNGINWLETVGDWSMAVVTIHYVIIMALVAYAKIGAKFAK